MGPVLKGYFCAWSIFFPLYYYVCTNEEALKWKEMGKERII